MYFVELSRQAMKDRKLLKAAGLEEKVKTLLNIIALDPFHYLPPYEILSRNLRGNISRRINVQHRLVYDVIENSENLLSPDGTPYEGIVRVKRMWTHYE